MGLYCDLIDSCGEILVPPGSFWGLVSEITSGSPRTHLARGLVAGLLDLLEEPGHPELLLFLARRHQEHLLGRGGVVGDLAGSHHLPGTHRVVPVQLDPAAWEEGEVGGPEL